MTLTPEQLNSKFGIKDQVVFKTGAGGLTMVEVSNAKASATIALQGAHLLSWAPKGQSPVIWLSTAAKFAPGKSVRGGIPICWPWFGPHESEASYPAHGYARTVEWDVVSSEALANGATRLLFRFTGNEASAKMWPHATPCDYQITIGTALELELITRNQESTPVTIGQALHTYFAISDIREVDVDGLNGCPYLDKVDGLKRKQQSGTVTFSGETDRIYLDSTADCIIEDSAMERRICISKRNSASTIVWNPWNEKAEQMGDLGERSYLGMVCVESANAADDVVTIPAGGEHRLYVRYDLEPLA
ncbi:MAG: D-hexose-6-phosphate mutarotase [Pseudomonadota bacterium]|nr:D-hexose-6-phosphate mutarotase [Pseudomonadota bacterium]